MIIRRLLIVVFFLLAVLCPNITFGRTEHNNSHINIWFAVDSSSSTDEIQSIIEKVPGAKYGLIVQDYSVYDAVPLTFDKDVILSAKSNLVKSDEDTDLAKLLDYTKARAAAYYDEESINVIILITDKDVDYPEKDISSALQTIKDSGVKNTETKEIYFVFAFIVLLLLLWEGEDILYRILLEKEDKNA